MNAFGSFLLVSFAGVVHESALARTAAFQGFQAFQGEHFNEPNG